MVTKKCHNCRGTGKSTGCRKKMLIDKNYQPKFVGRCLYCKGIGYK